MHPPKIISVNISKEKGTIKTPVDKISINEKGIVGDAHSGQWHRQVSILSKETIDEFSKSIGRQIRFGEFAENITTKGLDLSQITILDSFKIGKATLEVTQIGKECHGDKCAIFREVGKCVMPHAGIFCRVVSGGTVKAGDEMTYCPRPLKISVITLSDRASKGEYEDKSGPQIVSDTKAFFADKPWKLEFSNKIIPDESSDLERELHAAVSTGSDIVFTTGGTGIGPRDITPEVVNGFLDRTIPGIMEYIRVKYGAKTPNALLSRSTAGVKGKTLIYTLPGSVKAVREYMEEILKTIEHSVFMLNNVGVH